MPAKVAEPRFREFHELRPKGSNDHDYNLTELNAAEAVDNGFMSHSDWQAHCARYGHVAKRLSTAHNDQITLFDWGCGKLQLPYFLHRNRIPAIKSYWAMDLRAQPAWLDEAQWKSPMHLVRGDVTRDRMPTDELADIAVSFEVFEHMPRELGPEFLFMVHTQLKGGGLFLFSTPNAGVAKSTAENHHGSDGVAREWDYREKLELLEKTGFRVEASYGTFCGITRLPPEVWTNPIAKAIREFHHNSFAVTALAAAYPELSNNSLQVCRKI